MRIKRLFSALLVLSVFLSGIGIAFWATRPPAPPSETNPDYPAYQQMLANIEAMTKEPHPSGSKELADVRNYLLSQIEGMGLEYDVQSTVCSLDEIAADDAARKKEGAKKESFKKDVKAEDVQKDTLPGKVMPPSGKTFSKEEPKGQDIKNEAVFDENGNVTLYNILVKLDSPGTDSGVLFMAHYDSEFGVPGACDDMTSVCALLEAMRRQAGNPNLKYDLYFLFTDGEELGGMGAKVFVRDNSELKDRIDLVVNMDARGTSGGLFMFESSVFDYDQVHHFKAASSHPISYSWLSMIYRQMSNGTDLTRFLNAGYHALNFAVAESVENYSSATDDLDHLDRGTAYHFLLNAFELSDYAAGASLKDSESRQDGVYFTLLPGLLVLMNGASARILTGAAVLAALAWLIWQLRRGNIRPLRILSAAGVQLLVIAASALMSLGAVALADAAGFIKLLDDEMQFSIPVFMSIAAVICVVAFAVFVLYMRKRSFTETLAGVMPLLMLFAAVTAIFFNAVSYLMTLPLLGLTIAALLEKKYAAKTIVSAVVGIGILLMYVPLCWLLFITLGLNIMPLIMALAAIPVTLIAALFRGGKRLS